MKTFSAQELEDRLLDYLYEELDADDKAAFEAALPGAPAIVEEIEAHRGTRMAMADLKAPVAGALSADAMAALFAAADVAVAVVAVSHGADIASASTAVPVSADKAVATTTGGFSSWLKRFAGSLSSAMMTPAFATAAVALLVTGVAVVMAQRGELPGEDTSAKGQMIDQVAPVAVAEATTPAAAAPVAPEPAAAPPARDEAPVVAESELAAAEPFPAAGLASGAVAADADTAPKPVGKAKAAVTRPAATKGAPAPSTVSLDAQLAQGRTGDARTAEKQAEAVSDSLSDGGYASVPSNTRQDQPSAKADSEAGMPVERAREQQVSRPDAKPSAPAPKPSGMPAPAQAPAEVAAATTGSRNEDLYRGRSSGEQEEAGNILKIRVLWARYEREYAAGQFAEATKTLREIETLGGDAGRIRTARARIQDEQTRRTLDAKRAIPQPATKATSH